MERTNIQIANVFRPEIYVWLWAKGNNRLYAALRSYGYCNKRALTQMYGFGNIYSLRRYSVYNLILISFQQG